MICWRKTWRSIIRAAGLQASYELLNPRSDTAAADSTVRKRA